MDPANAQSNADGVLRHIYDDVKGDSKEEQIVSFQKQIEHFKEDPMKDRHHTVTEKVIDSLRSRITELKSVPESKWDNPHVDKLQAMNPSDRMKYISDNRDALIGEVAAGLFADGDIDSVRNMKDAEILQIIFPDDEDPSVINIHEDLSDEEALVNVLPDLAQEEAKIKAEDERRAQEEALVNAMLPDLGDDKSDGMIMNNAYRESLKKQPQLAIPKGNNSRAFVLIRPDGTKVVGNAANLKVALRQAKIKPDVVKDVTKMGLITSKGGYHLWLWKYDTGPLGSRETEQSEKHKGSRQARQQAVNVTKAIKNMPDVPTGKPVAVDQRTDDEKLEERAQALNVMPKPPKRSRSGDIKT